MTRRLSTRATVAIALALAGVAALGWYLYDPPWIGGVTSGFGRWQNDGEGRRFRWTLGRAAFYVPREATSLKLPLRAAFPAPSAGAVRVSISVDDRQLTETTLDNPDAWVTTAVPLPARGTRRRFRRIDLHISRTVGDDMRGVQVGEVEWE
jgi:hypothetical protein